ncbi:MAG: alpha-amylase [Clostridia bacterium]|nr:alpha-amylase [Clostridia bacterium]
MKRFFAILLTLALLASSLALSACGGDKVTLNVIDDNVRNWYEIFVYSFYDTDNDGIGDLNGVTAKLDYIKEMGFNGIWLMPIHPSPTYHKYDVTDYYSIHPDYGTLEDFKTLVDEAHKRGIRVIIDLVVNHTSDSHPWFTEACSYIRKNGEPGGAYGDFYNFRVTDNNAYHDVMGTKYSYEGQFWSGMPDLNLNSENVREEIKRIMSFWLTEYDVDGFRLDAVTSYYTGDLQGNIDFLSWLNTEAKRIKPQAYIVGEAWVGSDYTIDRYYESGCDSFFLFTGAQAGGTVATAVKQCSGKAIGQLFVSLKETYGDAVLAPFLGNHDTMRPGSFMPGMDNVKMAAGVLSMMNGGVFVYYGEEIGMISKGGNNSDPAKRIAMKWEAKNIYEGCCYLPPENTPVDASSYYYPSVAEQAEDADSILNYYKKAMELRNRFPSIARGTVTYYPEGQNNYICVITKEYQAEKITIVFNMDSFEQTVTLDKDTLGYNKLVGELYAAGGEFSFDASGALVMPPQSIAIFK